MDLLTKYRPVRSLDFYQTKVLRFLYSSEGTEDLRALDIPYGSLGFDSPLHFIRCIPEDLADKFAHDKLFERISPTLRKGFKVFLSTEDGKVQSSVYKGKKQNKNGEWEVILDGHRKAYKTEEVVPYKEFLRKNIALMLVNGEHRVVGTSVQYEEPKWAIGDALYYKPSKRWATIDERQIYTNGKVFCKIKLDKTKSKREKVLRVPLWELTTDAVPYKIPIIPQNNANISNSNPTSHLPTPNNLTERPKKPTSISENEDPQEPQRFISDTLSSPKLSNLFRQVSQQEYEQEGTKSPTISKAIIFPTRQVDSVSSPATPTSKSINDHLPHLQHSPKSPRAFNNYSEAPTIRSKLNKPTRRPLTEYFHTHSEDVTEYAYQPVESNKFVSVSNLVADNSVEDEDLGFENYTDSLRKSARNILLARQAADAAQRRSFRVALSKASQSTDNLERLPKELQLDQSDHKSIGALNELADPRNNTYFENYPQETFNYDNYPHERSESPSPPPPLPKTLPPSRLEEERRESEPVILSPSAVERYFIDPSPNNMDHHGTNPNSYFLPSNRQETLLHSHYQAHGSVSSDHSTSHDNGSGTYSVADIQEAVQHQQQQQYENLNYAEDNPDFPNYANVFHFRNPNLYHAYSVPAIDNRETLHNNSSMQHTLDRDYSSSPNNYASSSEIRNHPGNNYEVDDPHRSLKKKASRYQKNPSALSKSQHGEHFQKAKSVPNILEPNQELIIPPPFSSKNIHSAVGKGRGIQAGYNSCYADVSLMSLFYCTNIFDRILLHELESDKGMKKDVKMILRQRIVKPLRLSAFCSRESISHLREAMLPLSSKLNSSFMDAEEFLYLLFENALDIPQFTKYSNGTKDFMHQIIVRPKDRSRCQDIQFLFETSLEINGLQFKELPNPALMLCMPRCNGRLVYYEAIIPNLSLNVGHLIDQGPKKCICGLVANIECTLCISAYGEVSLAYCQTCQNMAHQIHYHIGHEPLLVPKAQSSETLHLLAVICIRANLYATFVKTGIDRHAPWLFFEALPTENPQVTILEDFGRWMEKLEKYPGKYREFAKVHPYLKRIMTESHVCIYYSPKAVLKTQFQESFMI